MKRTGNVDDVICIEADCTDLATHERPLGMIGEEEIVELICEAHDTDIGGVS